MDGSSKSPPAAIVRSTGFADYASGLVDACSIPIRHLRDRCQLVFSEKAFTVLSERLHAAMSVQSSYFDVIGVTQCRSQTCPTLPTMKLK